MLKKLLFVFSAAAVLACPAFAKERPIASFGEVYDEFSTEYSTDHVRIWIDGDLPEGRVSLFTGKDPGIKNTDPKDTEADPIIKYCKLGNHGGEENRAFKMYTDCPISKDRWTKVTINFKPRMDGKIRLSIHCWYAQAYKLNSKDHFYDDFGYGNYAKFEVKGATLKDPVCQDPKKWGLVVNKKTDLFPDKIKFTLEKSKDKGALIQKWLRSPREIAQTIVVKKDKEVTISFYVKGDAYFHAKM